LRKIKASEGGLCIRDLVGSRGAKHHRLIRQAIAKKPTPAKLMMKAYGEGSGTADAIGERSSQPGRMIDPNGSVGLSSYQ
jgi:hypothetical protein